MAAEKIITKFTADVQNRQSSSKNFEKDMGTSLVLFEHFWD